MTPGAPCIPCRLTRQALDDATDVLRTESWVAHPAPGAWPLGSLALVVRRHVAMTGQLTSAEADEVGGLLRALSGAVAAVHRPSQVYVGQWSHHDGVPSHVHLMVQPVGLEEMARHPGLLGPWLQAALLDEGVVATDEKRAADASLVRAALAAP